MCVCLWGVETQTKDNMSFPKYLFTAAFYIRHKAPSLGRLICRGFNSGSWLKQAVGRATYENDYINCLIVVRESSEGPSETTVLSLFDSIYGQRTCSQ